MKTQRLLQFLLILASGFFIQCTSDPIPGPPGADGKDGIDGIDGIDGVDGTTSCVSCHSDEFRDPIRLAYAESLHGSGNTWSSRGTSATCSRCHGNEGFVDYLSGLYVDSLGNAIANPDGYLVGNPINCSGCHDMHRSFNFEEDGNDKAVRSIEPVNLFLDPNITIDIRNASDELGLSNLCVNCHQPRDSYDIPGPTADYIVTSSRFGPHHGPQSVMLEGIMGANISGSVAYPGVGSAGHREGSSCIACHMGESSDPEQGDHTWQAADDTCLKCHSSRPPAVTGFQTDYDRLLELLVAEGALTPTGSAVQDTFPAHVAQAAWNWRFLMEDQSKGVHNPNYAKALLKNSIEALEN